MSRVDDWEGDEGFQNEWAFWERRTRQVMAGKPMRKALAELREALLALPEKRLISGGLSTVGKNDATPDRWGERAELLEREGEGVCAVGAFVWHKKVKAGADPQQALRDLPLAPEYGDGATVTQDAGKDAGLSYTLAWILMSRNDETYEGLTPEARYEAFLAWIEEKLAVAHA